MGFGGAGGEGWVSGTEGIVLPTSARWFQLCALLCTWPTRARLPALEDLGSGKGPPTPSLARVDSRHRIPLECNVWLSSGKCQRGQVQSPRLGPPTPGPLGAGRMGGGRRHPREEEGRGRGKWRRKLGRTGPEARRAEGREESRHLRLETTALWTIEMNLGTVFIQDPQGSESAQGPPRRFSFWASGDPFTPAEAWRARAPRVAAPWGWPGRAQAWELGWTTRRAAFPLFHFPKFPQCYRPVPRDPKEGSLPLLSSEHLPKEIKALVPLPLAPGVKRKWGAESHEDKR